MSGVPARDYIFQTEPYEEQIKKAAKPIREADYILFGLGAGMSTAAGAQYGGDFFKENFGEFMEKYGTNVEVPLIDIIDVNNFNGLSYLEDVKINEV